MKRAANKNKLKLIAVLKATSNEWVPFRMSNLGTLSIPSVPSETVIPNIYSNYLCHPTADGPMGEHIRLDEHGDATRKRVTKNVTTDGTNCPEEDGTTSDHSNMSTWPHLTLIYII